MTTYILKLLILIPLVCGMAFGALYLWRKLQPGFAIGQRDRRLRLIEALPVGAASRLAVIEFGDKQLLLSVARGRIELVSEAPLPANARD